MNTLFTEVNPVPVKAALELLGMPAGQLRLPLTKAESGTVENLKKCLKDLNYL